MVQPTRREFLIAGLGGAVFPIRAVAESQDLATLTLKQASDLIRRREISAVELTEACLKRIDTYNPALNAFVTVAREQALETARRLDSDRQRNRWRGPLHGIPVAFKDNIDTAGIRTTGASALFKDRMPEEDADVVARVKQAGAIVLGKLNLHEFALGGTNAVTYFGPVHNPWAMDHHPGGSSGGNAAAVAADLCLATLGTDTGGSIRIPASYCGIVGFKPTAGRVSNRGIIPNSWTFDTVGPMCKTVEDAALMLGVIAGYDEGDPTSVDTPVIDYLRALRGRVSKLRVGVPRMPFYENLERDVAKAVDTALDVIRQLAANVTDVQIPTSPGLAPVSNAEIYAYHAPWITKTPELYQAATRRIVLAGADTKADAYAQGLRRVELARREITRAFQSVDVLVTPTTGGVASLIPCQTSGSPPAAPAPVGAGGGGGASGLPIGLQMSGAPFAEATVLALAHAYEQATAWHRRRPTLATSSI